MPDRRLRTQTCPLFRAGPRHSPPHGGTEAAGAFPRRDFVWSTQQDRAAYDVFRYWGSGAEQQRKPQEVAPEEMASAVLAVLQQNNSLAPRPWSVKRGCWGFDRAGKHVDASVVEGIRILRARNRYAEENGTVKLV